MSAAQESTIVKSGTYSAYISGTHPSNTWGELQQNLTGERFEEVRGKTVILRAWIKADYNCKLTLDDRYGNYGSLTTTYYQGDWKEITVQKTVDENSNHLLIRIGVEGSDIGGFKDGYFDDIRLYIVGETVLYINQYYEMNITTGQETSYYYLGGRLLAMKQSDNLTYLHQDLLSGTSPVTNDSGE